MNNKRQIKFRVWDSISELLHPWYKINHIPLPQFNKDHYTLMQYTGVEDHLGIPIYEGDIVEYFNRRGVIEWHEYQASFDLTFKKVIEGKELPYEKMKSGVSNIEWRYVVKVVGNIYENKNLI